MGRLYVANCTPQNMQLYYRLDFNDKGVVDLQGRHRNPKFQAIKPGKQEVVGGDNLHLSQMQEIIDQITRYGAIATVDAVAGRMKGIIAYVWNIDQPVPAKAIIAAVKHNSALKIAIGRDRRQKAAIAANDALIRQVQSDMNISRDPTGFEVTFEQLEQSEAGEARIEEGVRVDKRAQGGGGKPPAGKRAKKAA